MKVNRYPENPLVTPKDVKPSLEGYEVLCAFNAGVIEYGDEILMLMRVAERPINHETDMVLIPIVDFEAGTARQKILSFSSKTEGINLDDPRIVLFPGRVYLTSISHLRIARSTDGRHFTVDERPTLSPDQEYESYGIEDPRITKLGDTYYVVYKGVAVTGITQCLASTKDFVRWEKHGVILPPENMDAMIFPEKIRGKYAALHRPYPRFIGSPNMWVSYSEDLIHWGEHQFMLGCAEGTWEGGRIGGGAVPFMTDRGWLEIYHAATPGDRYCLGAVLLDKDYPERVIAKSREPILEPDAPYEVHGFKDNVVFTCGAIVRNDTVSIYYGAADEVMCGADMSLREIMDGLGPICQV
ncbi:MAG: glycoside hydrolase family 130 protein [Armatimonadetes bacterium]|nr:glycoside hydrolase family 130 protein [Armatimonadota bacterium]